MQVVASLLSLQKNRTDDERSKLVFEQSQKRVEAMAFVHELLYQSESLNKIPLDSYISRLTNSLLQTHSKGNISLAMDIEEASLGIDQAIPCGLVINEFVANAMEHAFSEGQSGKLEIKARLLDDEIEISIADNGRGMPADFDLQTKKSLGLMLAKGLVEIQLRGTWDMTSGKTGTKHTMRFKKAEQ